MKSGRGSTIEGPGGHAFAIPPRPHLRPGIADAKDKFAPRLKKGLRAALLGDVAAATASLDEVGLIGQNAVRNKITEGPFVPLSPKTLAKRRTRGRTGEKPLIDLGAYRNSISYVIRPKDRP